MKYLLIGLGNVGPEYAHTRHNVGFLVLDELARQRAAAFRPERLAQLAICQYRGRTLYLLKPTTYMNHSGQAVAHWRQKLQLPAAHSLVVVDDLALPFGQLRLRPQGSAAGHNGLRSIEEHLHTQAYPRLRVGIGNAFPKGRQAAYVLAPFSAQEQAALPPLVAQACQTLQAFCTLGLARTMAQCNSRGAALPEA